MKNELQSHFSRQPLFRFPNFDSVFQLTSSHECINSGDLWHLHAVFHCLGVCCHSGGRLRQERVLGEAWIRKMVWRELDVFRLKETIVTRDGPCFLLSKSGISEDMWWIRGLYYIIYIDIVIVLLGANLLEVFKSIMFHICFAESIFPIVHKDWRCSFCECAHSATSLLDPIREGSRH